MIAWAPNKQQQQNTQKKTEIPMKSNKNVKIDVQNPVHDREALKHIENVCVPKPMKNPTVRNKLLTI